MLWDLASLSERLSHLPRDGSVSAAPADHQRAAVAAILRAHSREADAEILLIERAVREGDPWSGHMAFPGGRKDPSDADLIATAIRETREEVGIDLASQGALLGRLPDVPAVGRGIRLPLTITPFVFRIAGDPEIKPNHEVADAIWMNVGALARGEYAGTFDYMHEGEPVTFPCWRVGTRVVWGLTYRMLQVLFEAQAI